jgi:hypothetical protein
MFNAQLLSREPIDAVSDTPEAEYCNVAGYIKKFIELYKRWKPKERVSSFISSVFPFPGYRPNNKQIRLRVQS